MFDPEALPRVFRITPGAKFVVAGVGLLLVVVAVGFLFLHPPWPMGAAAALLAGFGALGILDATISRIVLEPDELLLVSLLRRRRYPRALVLAAKVENDVVWLELRGDGRLQLPRTGHHPHTVRNAVHAWIRRGLSHQ